MIATPEQVRLIQTGRKTTHRRIAQWHESTCPVRAGDRLQVHPGQEKPAVCRLLVTDTARQALYEVTQLDALAEGHRTTADFQHHWMLTRDELYRRRAERPDDDQIRSLFIRRHADAFVWIIHFTLDDSHVPRMLTPAARPRGSELGYTAQPGQAMRHEPEAIPPAIVAKYAKTNNELHASFRAGLDHDTLTEYRSLEDRLGRLRQLAADRGLDVRSDLRVITNKMDAIEKKIRQQRSAA